MISKVTMNTLDIKLLDELSTKGWQKVSILASSLGVGERTVYRRIRKMKKEGIINMVPIPNPVLLGYKAWSEIGIKVEPEYLDNVVSELVGNPSIYAVHLSLGRFRLMAVVLFDTFDKLTLFINSEIRKIKGVQGVETMPYICPRKYYRFRWPAPVIVESTDRRERYSNNVKNDVHIMDEVDQRIFDSLISNALTSPVQLSSILDIKEGSIRRRLKRMLDSGFFTIESVLNPELAPNEAGASIGIITENRNVHEVLDDLLKYPTVYFASESIGRFSIMMATRFHSMYSLAQFVNVHLPMIKGVASIETFLSVKVLKYHGIHLLSLPHLTNSAQY
jgi:Lrp/AsnC family transcriptional regulator for asnA, asnC and gidA